MAENHVEGIVDVFRCFICMEQLRDARLCPHCSKFCCYECIRRWIGEQHEHCPHCRAPLRLANLVKCRWADEVNQHLDTLRVVPLVPQRSAANDPAMALDKCTIHSEKLSVYCCTCKLAICHHCALWGEQHSGHTLKPLDDEYQRRVSQINEQVTLLRSRLGQFVCSLHAIELNMDKIRKAKDDKVREIRSALDMMSARLDSEMKSKLITLISQKRDLSMEIEMIDGMLAEAELQLRTSGKAALIQDWSQLSHMLKQMQRSPPTLLPVSAVFTSEIVPNYTEQTFVLKPYSELRRKADPIYSSPLNVNGLSWRLKVYPDGNGVVRGSYLSVFIELSQGSTEPARYDYRVKLIPQTSAARNTKIEREFSSDFEVGECWGYNRFFKTDLLAAEGFLNVNDDCLVIKFAVRPPTYFQKCRDLEWFVEQLHIVSDAPATNRVGGCDHECTPPAEELHMALINLDENTNDDVQDDDDDDINQSIPSHLTEFGASAGSSNPQRTISSTLQERDVEDEESHHHQSIDNDIDDDDEEMAAAVSSISTIRLLSSSAAAAVDGDDEGTSVDARQQQQLTMFRPGHDSCPTCSPRSRKHIYRRIRARHHRAGDGYGGPNTDSGTDIEIADLEREIRSGVNSRPIYSQATDTRGIDEFIID